MPEAGQWQEQESPLEHLIWRQEPDGMELLIQWRLHHGWTWQVIDHRRKRGLESIAASGKSRSGRNARKAAVRAYRRLSEQT